MPTDNQLYIFNCYKKSSLSYKILNLDYRTLNCWSSKYHRIVTQLRRQNNSENLAGPYSVGSSGNAGQPGTGSVICLMNTPSAIPPSSTPSLIPQPRCALIPGASTVFRISDIHWSVEYCI